MRKVQLTIKQEEVAPATTSDLVVMSHGKTLKEELSTNVLDKFSREVTVDSAMSKVIDGTLDGAYESGVMYGRSLVNLYGGQQVKEMNSTDRFLNLNTPYPLASSKTYLLIVDVKSIILAGYNVGVRLQDGNNYTTITTTTGIQKYKFVASGSPTLRLYMDSHDVSNGSMATVQNIMLLEYQEGMENWDIPYFEGLCDVKMPILRNVGKNLFDGSYEQDKFINEHGTISNSADWCATDFIRVRPNTTYTQNKNIPSSIVYFCFYNEDKQLISTTRPINYNRTFTTPNNCHFIRTSWKYSIDGFDFQFEEGIETTTYEPYKTNILRTSEEIVLREVNGVCDTYNPLTGEYVKRIGEITLSGSSSEQWNFSSLSSDGTKAGFYILSSNITPQPKVGSVTVNNKLPILPEGAWGSKSHEGCDIGSNALAIVVNTSKLSTPDVGGIRTYLQSNPITVQYELAEPITTIVEPLTIPFAYENGHIILESGFEGQSLLPELKYSAPASKSGVLSTTSKTILKHEQHLHKFEDLLLRESILMDYRLMLTMLDSM